MRHAKVGMIALGCAMMLAPEQAWANAGLFSLPWTEAQDRYALDALERTVPERGPLACPDDGVIRYQGDHLPYARPVQVHSAFRERLRRFEKVVREVAIEHYGRAPQRIEHLGSLACRRIRGYPGWLSEHALGNAIDVAGFEFGPAPREAQLRLSRPLRKPFRVSVLSHWEGTRGAAAIHARFLRELALRLVARDDIFRVLLGPAYPGHKNHFHFDMGPYRLIDL